MSNAPPAEIQALIDAHIEAFNTHNREAVECLRETHLRATKNEEVVIPSSQVVSGEVLN